MANDDEEPLMEIENIKKKSDIVGLVEKNCILHIEKRGEQDGGADATVADDENGNEKV